MAGQEGGKASNAVDAVPDGWACRKACTIVVHSDDEEEEEAGEESVGIAVKGVGRVVAVIGDDQEHDVDPATSPLIDVFFSPIIFLCVWYGLCMDVCFLVGRIVCGSSPGSGFPS